MSSSAPSLNHPQTSNVSSNSSSNRNRNSKSKRTSKGIVRVIGIVTVIVIVGCGASGPLARRSDVAGRKLE